MGPCGYCDNDLRCPYVATNARATRPYSGSIGRDKRKLPYLLAAARGDFDKGRALTERTNG